MSLRVFIKAHWRKGFWNKPWFWLHFQRWPHVGFALLVCGVELAILKFGDEARAALSPTEERRG